MQIPLSISQTLPTQAALLFAARSALTTALLSHDKTFDLSRLSLLRFTMTNANAACACELMAQVEISQGKAAEAGQHYLICVTLDQTRIEFELLDRKRGLKKSILHHLHAPERRLAEDLPKKEVSYQLVGGECWPLEQLLIAAQMGSVGSDFSFFLYGVADSARPVAVLHDQGLTEILQEKVLIAQLI